MSEWAVLRSSNIQACQYFRKTKLLLLEFQYSGSIYAYADVSWSRYMAFRRAKSHGSYFMHQIRGRYNYQKIR